MENDEALQEAAATAAANSGPAQAPPSTEDTAAAENLAPENEDDAIEGIENEDIALENPDSEVAASENPDNETAAPKKSGYSIVWSPEALNASLEYMRRVRRNVKRHPDDPRARANLHKNPPPPRPLSPVRHTATGAAIVRVRRGHFSGDPYLPEDLTLDEERELRHQRLYAYWRRYGTIPKKW